MDIQQLSDNAAALQSQLDDLAIKHYTAFLEQTTSAQKLISSLSALPESISSASLKIDSLSSDLSSSCSQLTELSSSHAASRSSISALPPLLTLLESPQLIDLLIRTNKYSQAVKVAKHVLSLPSASIIVQVRFAKEIGNFEFKTHSQFHY
jgi:hypothetical protein